MEGRTAALAGALWCLATLAAGQEDQEKGAKTVRKEDVKSWTTNLEGREWSVRTAAPTYDGDTGLFRLSTAYTLPKGRAAGGLFRNNLDRDPKGIDFSVHGFTLAYGAARRLELFASGGLQNRVRVSYPDEPGFPNDYPFAGDERWQTGFGDLTVGAKYAFLDDYEGEAVGLALRAFAKLPTADEATGLGTGKTSFVGELVVSKNLDYAADVHGSIGYEWNGDPDGVDVANALRWGIGVNIPACHIFQIQAELTGKVYQDTVPAQTNVMDLVVGPAIWLKGGWFIRPALSYAMNYDGRGRDVSSAKRAGKQIEIGYHPGTKCCQVEVPPPPPPPPTNRPPTVSLDCVKESVTVGETTPCNATARDPDGDPLTYAWSTTAGRTTGSGPTVTLETAGTVCESSITVRVTVDDGRGGTATATDVVRVVCPRAQKPEPITCSSAGFPRNLARLNNVDKACLDDVATRLRQDPRSRVVIVGHADARETHPDVLGRKRAEAVKAYLVRERGIEDARVSTRSAGSTRPLETGASATARSRNSRVEIVFLPEGAAFEGS